MSESPELRDIRIRMQPGIVSRDGFLGTDCRSLSDILADDHNRVEQAGLSHVRIAARLSELRDQALAGLGEFVKVPPHFEVKAESIRGRLPCPFGEIGLHAKTNITVRNIRTNRTLVYTDLGIHLIETHGFYQGEGAVFRLDPETLIEFLGLPEADQIDSKTNAVRAGA